MLIEPSNLADDLEWMLVSGQANQAMLAEALITRFFHPVYTLALASAADRESASYAAIETFIRALSRAYTYQGKHSPRAWIFGIATQVCQEVSRFARWQRALHAVIQGKNLLQDNLVPLPKNEADAVIWLAVDAQSEKSRFTSYYYFLLGWSEAEISSSLQIPVDKVHKTLERLRDCVGQNLVQINPSLEPGEIGPLITQSLHARWSDWQLEQEDLDQIITEVHRQASQRKSRLQRAVSVREWILVGGAALVILSLFWGYNRLFPEPEVQSQPGQVNAIRGRTQATVVPTRTPPISFSYIAQKGDTVESVAVKFGLSAPELARRNGLYPTGPIDPGRVIEFDQLPSLYPDISGISSIQPVAHRFSPLNKTSGPDDIQRILSLSPTLWRSLWLDVDYYQYGPSGYIGPPSHVRSQFWASQTSDFSYLLSGPPQRPEYWQLTKSDTVYFRYMDTENVMIREPDDRSILAPAVLLTDFLHTEWVNSPTAKWRILGEDRVAGRSCVIVGWSDVNESQVSAYRDYQIYPPRHVQFCMDSLTGVVLRILFFEDYSINTITSAIIVRKLFYDVPFSSAGLFDIHSPVPHTYFRDYAGESLPVPTREELTPPAPMQGHERLAQVQPPPGFDPALYPLSFQYDPVSAVDPHGSTGIQVDLFAGKYYLGKIPFTDPWAVICDRSPDGRKVAYASWLYYPNGVYQPPRLAWLDLSHPQDIQRPVEQVEVNALTFAPDSRHLAFIAFDPVMGSQDLYILDTETNNLRKILDLESAWSLAWSPDGQYIALMGSESVWYQVSAMIVEVKSGIIVQQTPVDYDPNLGVRSSVESIPEDFPALTWGENFPGTYYGLYQCTRPPGK